jgi:hypothetical protein
MFPFKALAFLFFTLVLTFGEGCAPKYVSVFPTAEWGKAPLRKIVLVPVVFGQAEGDKTLRSGRMDPNGPGRILNQVVQTLNSKGYGVISLGTSEGDALAAGGISPDRVMTIGSPSGADALMAVLPARYEEREGGAAGVRTPASVAFALKLYRVKDGVLLWEGSYAETQESLSDDVGTFSLFVRRGGRWQTADELARYGVEEMLKGLPEVAPP